MGYQVNSNDNAIGNGGAGTPGAWDIIDSNSYDLEGRIVTAFMCLTDIGGEMSEMEEENPIGTKAFPGKSVPVDSKYLGYTYPLNVPFEGRYTKLVPSSGTFKVWFLK